MGSVRKNLDESQKKKYFTLFEKYFLKSFSSRLSEYTNPKIEVQSKKILNKNYTIVNSLLVATSERPEVKIDWRVYTKNPNNPLIRDLIIEGLSLARTQKEEFMSILNSNDGDIIANKILKEKPVLNIMTHALSASSYPLFQAFGEKLTFIRVVRSPATDYMLRNLMNWTEKWNNNDLRSISITYLSDSFHSTNNIPNILKGKEDEYLGNNKIGRAILLLSEWQSSGDRTIDSMKKESQSTIIEIPFEKFVFNPHYYVDIIAKSLGTFVDKRTVIAMKKQKVPRKSLTDAPESKIYRKQGWVPPDIGSNLTLEDEFNKGIEFAISAGASQKSIDLLEELQSNYLHRYKIL